MSVTTENGNKDLNVLIGESLYRMKEERIKEIIERIISSLSVGINDEDLQKATEGIKGSMSEYIIESRE